MQEGDVGASNSDLQTEQADDDNTHMPERCVRECHLAFNRKLSRSCTYYRPSCHFILHVVFFYFSGEASLTYIQTIENQQEWCNFVK